MAEHPTHEPPTVEAPTVEATHSGTRTLLLDGKLLDPPEGIRPVVRRVPSEARFARVPSAPTKEGHR